VDDTWDRIWCAIARAGDLPWYGPSARTRAAWGRAEAFYGVVLSEVEEVEIAAWAFPWFAAGLLNVWVAPSRRCFQRQTVDQVRDVVGSLFTRYPVLVWLTRSERRAGMYQRVLGGEGLGRVPRLLGAHDAWMGHVTKETLR
jgi:hypothetical protein